MPSSPPEVFACPETLLAIAPQRLDRLVQRFRNAWKLAPHVLDPQQRPSRIDRLMEALCDPSCQPPAELVTALHMIRELGQPHEQDALLSAVRERGWDLDLDQLESPADLATAIWLCDPQVLECQYARRRSESPRSFEYFQASSGSGAGIAVNEKRLSALQGELEAAFLARGKGAGAKLLHIPEPTGNRFIVRHGESRRRKGCITEGELGSVCYRPARFDTVIYLPRQQEMAVHARSVWETELYCQAFGRHLFDDPQRFLFAAKYTLEPLRMEPLAALQCRDVAGLEFVTWCEVHYAPYVASGEVIVHRADDLLRTTALTPRDLPRDIRLVQASFRLQFRHRQAAQRVTIRPANVAQYPRDADAPRVEAWLRQRGFILEEASDARANNARVLESA